MKDIRHTVVRLVVVSLLAAPLAGCGIENAVGPVADRTPAAISEASVGTSAPELAKADRFIEDPGTPNDDSSFTAGGSGTEYVSGTSNSHRHKPKKRKH